MFELSYEQLETIGAMADKADNLIHAAQLPMPPSLHVEGLTSGLQEIRDVLNELYAALGGVDPQTEEGA